MLFGEQLSSSVLERPRACAPPAALYSTACRAIWTFLQAFLQPRRRAAPIRADRLFKNATPWRSIPPGDVTEDIDDILDVAGVADAAKVTNISGKNSTRLQDEFQMETDSDFKQPGSSEVSASLERIETVLSTLASAISCMQEGTVPRAAVHLDSR